MNSRVLIAYASRTGATREVAEVVAGVLSGQGFRAEVRPAGDRRDVKGFRAVILGTAIRETKPLPEAMEFVERHRRWLQRAPFALFAVCLSAAAKTDESRAAVRSALAPAARLVRPVRVGVFAGAVPGNWAPFMLRDAGWLQPVTNDLRDWTEIRAWADDVARTLTRSLAHLPPRRYPSLGRRRALLAPRQL